MGTAGWRGRRWQRGRQPGGGGGGAQGARCPWGEPALLGFCALCPRLGWGQLGTKLDLPRPHLPEWVGQAMYQALCSARGRSTGASKPPGGWQEGGAGTQPGAGAQGPRGGGWGWQWPAGGRGQGWGTAQAKRVLETSHPSASQPESERARVCPPGAPMTSAPPPPHPAIPVMEIAVHSTPSFQLISNVFPQRPHSQKSGFLLQTVSHPVPLKRGLN